MNIMLKLVAEVPRRPRHANSLREAGERAALAESSESGILLSTSRGSFSLPVTNGMLCWRVH